MKRFKKSLVTLLVLVFVLSIMSTGFAAAKFSDVTNEDLSDALARLVALKIIDGYPDGTFKPNNNITRAEFAKVVVTSLGLGNAAQYAQGMTKFKDVTAAHWASGYIKVASDLGVVNGYPDGTFKPENNVTYAEAITMIVRALGYEPKAKALGGYPGGYLAIAAEKEITKGINVVGSLGATRGDVARMLNNALEVPLMVQKTYGQFPEYAEDDTKSLLKTKLGVEVVEGVVISFDDEEMTVRIKVKDEEKEYKVAEGVSFKGLEDATVKAWKLSDKLVYFDVKSTVTYDAVASVVYKDGKVQEIKLFNLDKSYKVADQSGLTQDIDKLVSDVSSDDKLDGLFYGRFIIADGKITKAAIYEVVNKPYMVESADAGKETITYRFGDATGRVIRLGNYDGYKVVKDGKEIKLADLKKGDIFYTYTAGDEIYIFAVSKKVDGKLTKLVVDEKAMVAGKYYNINNPAYMSKDNGKKFSSTGDFTDLLGESVTAYLGLKDAIVYVIGDTEGKTESTYGILIRTWSSDVDYARIMLLDGTIKTYTVAEGFGIVNKAVYNDKAFVKFTVNADGEAEFEEGAVLVEDFTTGPASDYDVNKDASKVGSYFVTSDTKIINVTNYKSTDRKVNTLTWDDIKNAGRIKGFIADADEDVKKAKVILINDPNFVSAEDKVYAGIVLDSAKIGTNKYEITLDKGNGKESIIFSTVYNKGDIVTFKLDKEGKGVIVSTSGRTETRYVVDVSGSFIKLGTIAADGTITENSAYYKVASDAVIYDFTGKDPVEAVLSDLSDIVKDEAGKAKQADKVTVYVENDIIKVIKIEALGKTGNW